MKQQDKGDHYDPLISVIVIDSRSETNPEWVSKCLSSITGQSYEPYQVIVIKNTDKQKTIGECWNRAIQQVTGEWILFVGDDDYLSPDYIQTLATYIKRFKTNHQHIDAISTFMTTFDEDKDGMALLHRPPTGCWRTSFFGKLRFDETLTVGVDRTLLEEARKMGAVYVTLPHHYGYYYRQHGQGTCTRVKINPDPTDIYMIAKYPAFTAPIRDVLRDEGYSVQLLNEWKPELAKHAKVIWQEWADENAIAVAEYPTNAIKILRIHAYEVFSPWVEYIKFEEFDHILIGSQHIRDYLETRLKKELTNAQVMNLGVDITKFTIGEHQYPNKVAWMGDLVQKKGAQLLLEVASKYPWLDFYCVSKNQDPDIKRLFDYRDLENIHHLPYQEDIAKFYQDKTYILNTSPREGNPVSVLEGMACGLSPIIYNWDGAKDIYKGCTFNTTDNIASLIKRSKSPEDNRKFIVENYNFNDMYNKIKRLII